MSIAKKLSTYDDIDNVTVQTWNRTAAWFSAGGSGGLEEANRYLERLGDLGRQRTLRMLADIRDKGMSVVRKEVMSTLTNA